MPDKGYVTRFGCAPGANPLKRAYEIVRRNGEQFCAESRLKDVVLWLAANYHGQEEVIIDLDIRAICYETEDYLQVYAVEYLGWQEARVISVNGSFCLKLKKKRPDYKCPWREGNNKGLFMVITVTNGEPDVTYVS